RLTAALARRRPRVVPLPRPRGRGGAIAATENVDLLAGKRVLDARETYAGDDADPAAEDTDRRTPRGLRPRLERDRGRCAPRACAADRFDDCLVSDCEAAAVFVSDDQCIPSVETVALPAGVVAPGEIAARAERDAEVVALRRAEQRVAAAIDAD